MNTEYLTPVNLQEAMLDSINNKYNKSKIYKIVSASSNKIYIGSTTRTLAQRLSKHVCSYRQYLAGKTNYTTSYAIISLGDYSIQLISNHMLENKEQLFLLEGKQIMLYRDVCVNSDIPGRTKQEYYEDHKEHLLNKGVQYYLDNKETIKENVKQYRLDNKEKINENNCFGGIFRALVWCCNGAFALEIDVADQRRRRDHHAGYDRYGLWARCPPVQSDDDAFRPSQCPT